VCVVYAVCMFGMYMDVCMCVCVYMRTIRCSVCSVCGVCSVCVLYVYGRVYGCKCV
jgi:hypothetical protein